MPRTLFVLLCIGPATCAAQVADDDLLLADFEGKDYGAWKVTGTAFGPGPVRGTLPGQMPVSGYLGQGLVNSFFGGDASTGTLTSPPFKIERKYINFLVGGGKHEGKTCINLLVAGKVVRTATGPNDRPGGSEQLDWHTWDVAELAGKDAVIEIVDDHTGGWGHINIDHIVQSNRRKMAGPQQRTLVVTCRYLHLPVRIGAPMRRMKLLVGGKTVREFDIELAEDRADFHVFSDVAPFKGEKLTIETTLPDSATVLEQIAQSDELPDAGKLYREKHRPQYHFTARRGWLNDPNGLVYHDGEYHLFFQHNPYGWSWGNMHWGHAVSKDLVHWQELDEALYPRQYGDWCFSGSAAVMPHGGLALAYTSTGRGECIALSRDRGRSWSEITENPIVKHRGRDPRILWHEPTKRWVMAVYDEEKGKTIAFYSSADLKAWRYESRIGEFYECPDLFELPVDGDPKSSKWVLYAADGRYVLGTFDGNQFTAEPGRHRLWYGRFYAAQTFSNGPGGRRIQIGWAQIEFPGMPFNQQMTIPVQLVLRTTADGVRLCALPVEQVHKLWTRDDEHIVSERWQELAPGKHFTPGVQGELLDIRVTLRPDGAERCGIVARGTRITLDRKTKTLTCGKETAPLLLEDGLIRLRVLVDRGSIEVFVNDGRIALVAAALPRPEDMSVELFAEGGAARAQDLRIAALRSAWSMASEPSASAGGGQSAPRSLPH
jgi:fructan beta-fructosidase